MACSALRDISRSNQRHHSYCYLPVIVPDVANGHPSASINGGIEEAAWWIDSATQCPRRPKPETHWPQSAAQQHVAARRALAPDISPRRPRASYEHRARARHPGPRSRPTKIKRLQADGTDAILARRSMASPFWGGPPSAPRARIVSRQRPRRCAAPHTHDIAHTCCSAQRSTAIIEQ